MTVSRLVVQEVKDGLSKKLSLSRIARYAKVSRSTILRIKATSHCPSDGKRKAKRSVVQRRVAVEKLAKKVTTKGLHEWPEHPSATSIQAAWNKGKSQKRQVSKSTVLRDLAAADLKCRVRPTKPCVDNDENRLAFAKAHKNSQWEKWVFSDEHFLSTNCYSCRTQYVHKKQELCLRQKKDRRNVPNLQVWACIGLGWRSKLVVFPRVDSEKGNRNKGWRLNGTRYRDLCINPVLEKLKEQQSIFMQDGAKVHWAKDPKKTLVDAKVKLVPDWPASSPDLNPIEHGWKLLNEEVAKRHPQTQEQLVKAAIEGWDSIEQWKLDNLVLSLKKKLEGVIKDHQQRAETKKQRAGKSGK
jgi:transposase